MKKYLSILLLLFSIKSIAQNNGITKVTYNTLLNFDISVNNTSELFFDNVRSLYVEGGFKTKSNNVKIDERNTTETEKSFYLSLIDKSLYTRDRLDGKIILAKEKIPKINWEIKSKFKDSILNFNCTKAIGKFRGRVYTVWFTQEIPVKFGPWKLQGLPGLILKAEDNLKKVLFFATKIESTKEFNLDILLKKEDSKTTTLKEYVELRNKDINNKVKRILSKIPRESKVRNLKMKKYKGLELVYEWEKTKEN